MGRMLEARGASRHEQPGEDRRSDRQSGFRKSARPSQNAAIPVAKTGVRYSTPRCECFRPLHAVYQMRYARDEREHGRCDHQQPAQGRNRRPSRAPRALAREPDVEQPPRWSSSTPVTISAEWRSAAAVDAIDRIRGPAHELATISDRRERPLGLHAAFWPTTSKIADEEVAAPSHRSGVTRSCPVHAESSAITTGEDPMINDPLPTLVRLTPPRNNS